MGKGREDDLTSLILAIGQMELVAGTPPAKAQACSHSEIVMPEEIEREQGTGLSVDARAIVVEDGQLDTLLVLFRGFPHARSLPPSSWHTETRTRPVYALLPPAAFRASWLPAETSLHTKKGSRRSPEGAMAGYAGLEPATSDVTGRRSNQLS